MVTALLIAILIVAGISMLFNVAYILHELGWFPHGKPRGEAVVWIPSQVSAAERRLEASAAGAARLVHTDHPVSSRLRRFAHPEAYDLADPGRKLDELLARAREDPTPSRIDDLINVANLVTSGEQYGPEPRAAARRAIEFLVSLESRASTRGG